MYAIILHKVDILRKTKHGARCDNTQLCRILTSSISRPSVIAPSLDPKRQSPNVCHTHNHPVCPTPFQNPFLYPIFMCLVCNQVHRDEK